MMSGDNWILLTHRSRTEANKQSKKQKQKNRTKTERHTAHNTLTHNRRIEKRKNKRNSGDECEYDTSRLRVTISNDGQKCKDTILCAPCAAGECVCRVWCLVVFIFRIAMHISIQIHTAFCTTNSSALFAFDTGNTLRYNTVYESKFAYFGRFRRTISLFGYADCGCLFNQSLGAVSIGPAPARASIHSLCGYRQL